MKIIRGSKVVSVDWSPPLEKCSLESFLNFNQALS